MSLTITNMGDQSVIPNTELGELFQGQWFVQPHDIVSMNPLVLSEDCCIYIKLCNDDQISTCFIADRFVESFASVESHELFTSGVLLAFPNQKLVTMIDVSITTDNIELTE